MVGDKLNSEETYKKISLIISLLFHAIVFAVILFWPSMRYDFPPPGKEGILVIFGDDAEGADNNLDVEKEDTSEDQKEDSPKEKQQNEDKEEKKKPEPDKKAEIEKDIEEDNGIVLESKKKNTKTEKKVVTEKTIKEAKSEFSKLFSTRGTNAKKNQGDPLGARDARMLEGITRGRGEVGEGLDSRGVLFEPSFDDSSQKSGRVVVRVCINEKGNVISSKYTQRGSTTTDWELIAIAEKNAKKYRFTPSNIKEQCGTIIIDFIVN